MKKINFNFSLFSVTFQPIDNAYDISFLSFGLFLESERSLFAIYIYNKVLTIELFFIMRMSLYL